jgi:hypothetical protein
MVDKWQKWVFLKKDVPIIWFLLYFLVSLQPEIVIIT